MPRAARFNTDLSRSTSPARPATGPARTTSRGPARKATGSVLTVARQGARPRVGRSPGRHLDDRRGDGQCGPERQRRGRCARSRCAARCHARRGQFAEDDAHGQPLADTHRVALLEDRLYYADGQIRDEVYEYGSFLQSQDVQPGRDLLGLPRPAQPRAPGTGAAQVVPQLPRRREVHGGDASLPRRAARAAPTVSAVTCRPRPTWWSIRATTTAFVSPGPISR